MKKALRETSGVQSLDRGLQILEAVARSDRPIAIAQLREVLGIDRSSVYRLANTLRRRGFLSNAEDGTDYTIGPMVWRLFWDYDWSVLVNACRPYLKALANRTGETAHLAVCEGTQTLFIDHQSAQKQVVSVSGQTGEFKPMYCTAHGKAMLADYGVPELRALFGSVTFEAYTATTITSVDRLAEACAEIQKCGYAVDDAEYQNNVRCLAVPIRDKDGIAVASVGISAPMARFSTERIPIVAKQVIESARQLGALFSSGL